MDYLNYLKILDAVLAVLPKVVAAYNRLKGENPLMTDEEAIELLRVDSQRFYDEAQAWLAAHPKWGADI